MIILWIDFKGNTIHEVYFTDKTPLTVKTTKLYNTLASKLRRLKWTSSKKPPKCLQIIVTKEKEQYIFQIDNTKNKALSSSQQKNILQWLHEGVNHG